MKKKFDSNYDIIINLVGYISNQTFLNFDIKELQKTLKINSIGSKESRASIRKIGKQN